MQCAYCRSLNVVWDFERGCVVCGDCGTVLDVIYCFCHSIAPKEEHSIRKSRNGIHKPSISRYTRTYLRLMRRASEYGLEIDNEVFKKYSSGTSPLVKVFKKPSVDLNKLTSEEYVKAVLDVMRKYPRLTSRTDRAKVALVKIALSMVSENEVNIKKLSHELRISEVHVRRLHRILASESEFLNDVKRTINNDERVENPSTS